MWEVSEEEREEEKVERRGEEEEEVPSSKEETKGRMKRRVISEVKFGMVSRYEASDQE